MKFILAIVLLSTLSLFAEETKKADKVVKTSETTYQIGKVSFDKSKGEISFPAALEQNEVLIEYLVTNPIGKIHETLFISDIRPFNLNVAMKLLGYQESKELISILDENYTPTDKYYKATEEQKKFSRFGITVSWKQDGKQVTYPAYKLLNNDKTKGNLEDTPWVYNGSFIVEGKFKPDLQGDIIAVYVDRAAMANYAGEGREDDTLWIPNKPILPPLGTPVTITLTQTNKPK